MSRLTPPSAANGRTRRKRQLCPARFIAELEFDTVQPRDTPCTLIGSPCTELYRMYRVVPNVPSCTECTELYRMYRRGSRRAGFLGRVRWGGTLFEPVV